MTMLAAPDPRPAASAAAARAQRFRALYVRELDFVWTVLSRLGVDDVDVEDAAHDVFMVVHRQLDRFEGRSTERTWLYAIARRIAWRHRRSERRRARRHGALAAEPHLAEDATDVDDALRDREARELLAAFLESLDRPKREAFVLGELEALPRTALGRALGVSPGTAYSRLRAARADFAAAFGPDGPRGPLVSRRARAHEPPPAEARQRLWLALPGGLVGTAGASGMVAGGITLALGMGLLGVIATVVPSRAENRGATESAGVRAGADDERRLPEREVEAEARQREPPRAGVAGDAAVQARSKEASRAGASRAAGRAGSTGSASSAGSIEPSRISQLQEPAPAATALASSSSHDLAEEAALLASARAAMRARRWAEARVQLERHAERYPAGLLGTERRASAVIVACEQGRHADALAEARGLAASSVPAALRASLRSSCVGEHLEHDVMIRSGDVGDQEER